MQKYKIPEQFLERVQVLVKLDDMYDVQIAVAKKQFDKAIEDFDEGEAYKILVRQRELIQKSGENHKSMWNIIHDAIPETQEGKWRIDPQTWEVERRGGRNISSGLASMLAGAMGGEED